MFKLFLHVFFVVATVVAKGVAFQEQDCANEGGTCRNTKEGCSGMFLTGKCPTQSSTVKCCVEDVRQEAACTNAGGMCKKSSVGCRGQFVSGKCPTQSSDVKCCVQGSASGNGNCNSGDKYETTLIKILGSEGQCQNSASDKKGNMFQGKMGYTCMGITPETGYNNRNQFPDCTGFSGHPADFVKWCYDRSQTNFKTGAATIYKKNYFNVCDLLTQPAFYVCSDISVNSGPGKAQEFMKTLGPAGNDMKSYATKLNQLHRELYQKIGGPNLQGWLKRADDRDRYISSC